MSELVSELISVDSGLWIGEHAWGIYLVGLATVLPSLIACYYTSRHIKQDTQQDVTQFAFYLSAGIIVCCITGFTVIATAIMEILSKFDAALASAIAMLLQKRYLFAFASIVAIGGNAILNRTLKAIFERVRPVHEHGFIEYSLGERSLLERGVGEYHMAMVDGWSFPSGHTSGAVVTYGILAYILLRMTPKTSHPVILVSAAALVFTIGSSRVFLQVHYLSDVIAGFLSGLCWLTFCIAGLRLIERRQTTSRMTAG